MRKIQRAYFYTLRNTGHGPHRVERVHLPHNSAANHSRQSPRMLQIRVPGCDYLGGFTINLTTAGLH